MFSRPGREVTAPPHIVILQCSQSNPAHLPRTLLMEGAFAQHTEIS